MGKERKISPGELVVRTHSITFSRNGKVTVEYHHPGKEIKTIRIEDIYNLEEEGEKVNYERLRGYIKERGSMTYLRTKPSYWVDEKWSAVPTDMASKLEVLSERVAEQISK